MEENLFTVIGRERSFGSEDKIRQLVARTPTRLDPAGTQAFELGLANGTGGLFLQLTHEQYAKLKVLR